jgi:hypothetical protein
MRSVRMSAAGAAVKFCACSCLSIRKSMGCCPGSTVGGWMGWKAQ